MNINVYTPEQQAIGQFDGGKITEQKPIGFPGEGAHVKRVGPLFYWSWAKAEKAGYIPLHPHQAFEIITYVIHGKAEHGDTLGTKSTVGAGGIQIMQTGSGVSHEEGFVGPDMEGFQIWFEPFVNEAIKQKPTYNQFSHEQLPMKEIEGHRIKTVIGDGSPVELVADVKLFDLEIKTGGSLDFPIPATYSLALLAIRGNGTVNETEFNHKEFIVISADEDGQASIGANKGDNVRLIAILVPTKVDYPLYRK
ncbi:pirin family protein [Anaerobacillus isosaccharinicus]|uniref:Pirin n=1 Tax=Anaerobacillus isosaccharinicus TaxID=1532552 RepID=A0A1S2LHZ7_9BACI|nr:pirin family protein [Anaerobacillus isosaccharinicus]MBA5586121.1 pirin family protein [Anaerobacillus isosaccharinicus]QOY35611.1 pirin family protein [Anaerobacillus isosaccharinicus]